MYHAVFTVYENKKVLFVNNGFAGNMAVLFNYCYVAVDVENGKTVAVCFENGREYCKQDLKNPKQSQDNDMKMITLKQQQHVLGLRSTYHAAFNKKKFKCLLPLNFKSFLKSTHSWLS